MRDSITAYFQNRREGDVGGVGGLGPPKVLFKEEN